MQTLDADVQQTLLFCVGRGGGLLGYCGQCLDARRREPRSMPSRVCNRSNFFHAGRKARRRRLTQSCRRADYQKRGDEIMHSHNLLWRRSKMKGPRRLIATRRRPAHGAPHGEKGEHPGAAKVARPRHRIRTIDAANITSSTKRVAKRRIPQSAASNCRHCQDDH